MTPDEIATLAYDFRSYFMRQLGDHGSDLTHELFIALLIADREDRIRDKSKTRRYALGTATQIVRNEVDKIIVRRRARDEIRAGTIRALRPPAENYYRMVLVNELMAFAGQRDTELLERFYWFGQTIDEISAAMRISRSAFQKRTFKAIARIRDAYYGVHRVYQKSGRKPLANVTNAEQFSWRDAATKALIEKRANTGEIPMETI